MTELFLKIFNKKEYWKRKMQECHDIMMGAEFKYRKAVRQHKKRSDLHYEYKVARVNFEKAYQVYGKMVGWL